MAAGVAQAGGITLLVQRLGAGLYRIHNDRESLRVVALDTSIQHVFAQIYGAPRDRSPAIKFVDPTARHWAGNAPWAQAVLATSGAEILVSVDGASTWQALTFPRRVPLDSKRLARRDAWAAVGHGSRHPQMYATTCAGVRWRCARTPESADAMVQVDDLAPSRVHVAAPAVIENAVCASVSGIEDRAHQLIIRADPKGDQVLTTAQGFDILP
jgi:hypothetical protein